MQRVAGGAALGAQTVLVRTGKQAQRSEDGLDPAPDRVLDSVAELPLRLSWAAS